MRQTRTYSDIINVYYYRNTPTNKVVNIYENP